MSRLALACAALVVWSACTPGDSDPSADGADPSTDPAPTAADLGPADGHELPGQDLDRIQVGEPAPDFTLASFEGGPVSLSDFRGDTNVILVFYRGHW